ncbi:sulfatase-like hydrolase/transferase [Paenibacillus sp. 1P07SE]|uniref:sulfatase-like hydrolase/transferase n=1 Tax=Paenibacillus sp. 1P07SE TaxID=3132209 RepID=UPI0039A48760
MSEELQRPNILLIQSDQHRYDCVGRSRDYPVRTPHMDRLAEEGLWFSQAYTPIPLCCPARQSLLNGRRPEAFGALWNYNGAPPMQALQPDAYAWPRELGKAGYRNGFCGKWHVNPDHGPEAFGFDETVGQAEYRAHIDQRYPGLTYTNGWFGERNPVELEDAYTHYLADRTIDMIERFTAEGKPWHLRLDFPDPHLPCRPSEPFASMYKPDEVPQWRSFDERFEGKPYIQKQQLYNWRVEDYTWQDWAPTVALYYGAISQVDDAIGKVLSALDRLGLAENTIVIYTSDHGDMCGGHRMMDKHYIMYDDVVHVPFIIRWPQRIQPGSVCDAFVYNLLDLPPTLLEAASLPVPEWFHGRTLMPILAGQAVSDWREEAVSTYNGQQFGLYSQRMLRTREWKYVWNLTDIDELYDLRNDPEELRNRIADPACEAVVADLRQRLEAELTRCGDAIINRWTRAQLLEQRQASILTAYE